MEAEERGEKEDNSQYIGEGVRRAQEYGRKNGIEIGAHVATPDDRIIYLLEGICGDEAIKRIFNPSNN